MTPESIAQVSTAAAVIIAAIISKLDAIRANRATEVAVRERAEVAARLESVAKTTESVHILVNSSMSAQLRISALALRRIAGMTSNKTDIEAAELAERLFQDHERKQQRVDDKSDLPAALI